MKNPIRTAIGLSALAGILLSFRSIENKKFGSRVYGIINSFTVGRVKHYNVELFGLGSGCSVNSTSTCQGTYTSLNTVSTVITSALGDKQPGQYVF